MSDTPAPQISVRKQPRQQRSAQLVADIVEAAAQVLAAGGAPRFTTARVAERAGVSVGSVYQYFPNKAAILFRLQADEWRSTSSLLRDILADHSRVPTERLRAAIIAFFRSECEEAAMRTALEDAAPYYRHAPEAQMLREDSMTWALAFIAEIVPEADADTASVAAELLLATMESVGKRISESGRPPAEVDRLAGATADMLCAWFERLAG